MIQPSKNEQEHLLLISSCHFPPFAQYGQLMNGGVSCRIVFLHNTGKFKLIKLILFWICNFFDIGNECSGPRSNRNRCTPDSEELTEAIKKMHDDWHHIAAGHSNHNRPRSASMEEVN